MSKVKRVLLMGGTGAMGVYLIPELLDLGYEVVVTSRSDRKSDRKGLSYIQGNAKDEKFIVETLKSGKYDAIVDFMVYRTDEFKERIKILLSDTVHYLFLSSYRVYAGSTTPLTEESPRLLDASEDQSYLSTDEYALAKARQEDILIKSKSKKWTIIRPAITYSKDRFQLGTMEANEFLHRALSGKKVIFPEEMLSKTTTLSWAGDVAQMIAKLVVNKKAYGETFTVSTSESHTWAEVIDTYKKVIDLDVKVISLKDYEKIIGRPYQIKYDRMFDRSIDNKKILSVTGMKQPELMSLEDGLRLELGNFIKSPRYDRIDSRKDSLMDRIVSPASTPPTVSIKTRVRNKLKQVKKFIRSKQEYDGAILSLGGYYNFGGLIQRYSLQKFLRKNGYNFKVFRVRYMDNFGVEAGDRTSLVNFSKKNIDEENFNRWLGAYYANYIVGSDQVWRDWYGGDWSKFSDFFLSFVKNKKARKIAYAASFGSDDLVGSGINARNRKKISKLIKKFDSISVREDSGIELVKQLGGRAEACLDPTLLLSRDDYSKLIDLSGEKGGETAQLFAYILDLTDSKKATIDKFAQKLDVNSEMMLPNSGKKLPSVESWLRGFRDAEFIVTDSFHGVAFSLINHKNFVVFGNVTRGLARMTDLLEPLGLGDRIVTKEELSGRGISRLIKPIDWDRVDKLLDQRRQESANWLLDAIKDKEG